MENPDRFLSDCNHYSEELGKDYRRLYQLKEDGATEPQIREAKAKIKADKRRLKNVIHNHRTK